MSSTRNIYLSDTPPVMRYMRPMKVAHTITGWRIDPNTGRQIEFILESSPVGPDTSYEDLTKRTFNYDTDVVELYSDKEVRFFSQRNRYLFENGLLQEFDGEPEEVDMSNMMSDIEITKIAVLPFSKLVLRLEEITSAVTMRRIFDIAEEIGRPAKILNQMKAKLAELEKK